MESPSYSSSPSKQITVIDVYDLAESINRDFEKLVGKFGNEPFESVVRKVISALETLEALAKYNDKDNSEILDLQKTIERFEQEKQQRLRDKQNLEKDIIDLEENYKREIDELCQIVQKLQTENKCIKEQIPKAPNNSLTGTSTEKPIVDEHFQILNDLRKMTHTQKERIKELQQDISSYCGEIESLRDSIERLIRQNKDLIRKNGSLQKQGRMLLLERAEILKRLQQSEEDAFQLKRVLNETSRACKDLELQKKLEQEDFEERSPRFTLAELREVLQEKNALKARVLELEERIDQYRASSVVSDETIDRPRSETPSENASAVVPANVPSPPPKPSISIAEEQKQTEDVQTNKTEDSEECLVFGPINREPDEKLRPWKYERRDSGVRRFFRFFKNSLGTSLTPRGSGAKLAPDA